MSTARGDRLRELWASRDLLGTLPTDLLLELPGRPAVLWCIRDYTAADWSSAEGAERGKQQAESARSDAPFLFKAFETGQIGPRRLARLAPEQRPRAATIHEYLDWTVTGRKAAQDGDYDFSGFRVLALFPRERSMWPAPGQHDPCLTAPRPHDTLGAPAGMVPPPALKGKAISAATIRTGPGYLEVPFVATHEGRRGRGYGRAVVEACEDVARALNLPLLLLCSTNEESVKLTWQRIGFEYTTEEQLEQFGVREGDLVHMQNTVQMHKMVSAARRWRPLLIKHQAFLARSYLPLDPPPPLTELQVEAARRRAALSAPGKAAAPSKMMTKSAAAKAAAAKAAAAKAGGGGGGGVAAATPADNSAGGGGGSLMMGRASSFGMLGGGGASEAGGGGDAPTPMLTGPGSEGGGASGLGGLGGLGVGGGLGGFTDGVSAGFLAPTAAVTGATRSYGGTTAAVSGGGYATSTGWPSGPTPGGGAATGGVTGGAATGAGGGIGGDSGVVVGGPAGLDPMADAQLFGAGPVAPADPLWAAGGTGGTGGAAAAVGGGAAAADLGGQVAATAAVPPPGRAGGPAAEAAAAAEGGGGAATAGAAPTAAAPAGAASASAPPPPPPPLL